MIKPFQLINRSIELTVLNIGAALHDCRVCVNGQWRSMVIQPPCLSHYLQNPEYFGATLGPVANRIANARFLLNGQQYEVDRNEGDHHLHGGKDAISFKYFTLVEQTTQKIIFELVTNHDCYPGCLTVRVTYQLQNNGFIITYDYQVTEDCPVNLSNHSYFNLDKGQQLVTEHYLDAQESKIWHNDAQHIPVSRHDYHHWPLKIPTQLFNNYIETTHRLRYFSLISEVELSVSTTYPGFMLYNSFYPGTTKLTDGQPLQPFSALCIEPQYMPNDINLQGNSLCVAGRHYQQHIDYQFITA